MWVVLEDDLVDACKPGDDVKISGILLQRWRPLGADNRCDIEIVLKANYVKVISLYLLIIQMVKI